MACAHMRPQAASARGAERGGRQRCWVGVLAAVLVAHGAVSPPEKLLCAGAILSLTTRCKGLRLVSNFSPLLQDGAAAARVTAFAAPSPCFAKPGLRTRVQGLCLKAKAKFELRDSPISDAAARLERVKQYAAVFRDEGMDGEVRKFNVRKVLPSSLQASCGSE